MYRIFLNCVIVLIFGFGIQTISAQSGTIEGIILDGELDDVLPFSNVTVNGTNKGSTSDFDGFYTMSLEPGIYTVTFSFVGYQAKEITEVVVIANETTRVDVTLNSAADSLAEVVISVTARRNTEASVLNLQKKSIKVTDGLSFEGIKRTGANNVASAVKNIPGVSVQGGKYVYVRGLGDR